MADPNPAAGESQPNPANGDWKVQFGAENVAALEPFKTQADFYKSYNDTSTQLKSLQGKTSFDWRKEVSGEDADTAKLLERFTDPKAFGKAYREAQNKIRSGELARPLPSNATEDQVKEWRAANGIPEKPEDYFAKLPDGLVIGKDDQPLFNEVAGELHKLGAKPEIVHSLAKWYYGLPEKESAKVEETDKLHAREVTDVLREAWGNDFRSNMGQVTSLLDGLGGDLKAQFMDATLPDGRRLFNSPDVLKWMAGLARELNPVGVLIPNAGEGSMQSIETELSKLKGMMADQKSDYWKGPNAEKNQARFRQLVDAQAKLKARAA